MNNTDTINYLKTKLSTDAKWAQRGLLAIFANQTNSEQVQAVVREHNNMGFRACDARVLTSLATQLRTRGFLTTNQIALLFRKMPVYARQLLTFHGDSIKAHVDKIK